MMRITTFRRSRLLRSPLAAVAATGLAAAALAAPTGALAAGMDSAAEGSSGDYCTSTGGVSARMHPWSGTNNDASQWMEYGGKRLACTYTAEDTSQITIFEETLESKRPTMAALAYYAEVPPTGGQGNPSLAYCVQLGGAWQVGNGLDGGGWTTGRGQRVYSMCVFGDGSAIDTWGLFYHSANIVRGIDLATVLKFADPY
jgi:putative hemolysin